MYCWASAAVLLTVVHEARLPQHDALEALLRGCLNQLKRGTCTAAAAEAH
jgi:hypothetical protein